MSLTTSGLDTCGCCAHGIHLVDLRNAPGLPALRYRVGTQPTFLRAMLASLPTQLGRPGSRVPARPLAALTTRAPDDASIALLDAWACVADVLTFYQERIANEGYLRTATERRSVLELARIIGYELKPGVAASAYLAFTAESARAVPGTPVGPSTATVPRGTRVQSVPIGMNELPQTFETTTAINARSEWNALQLRHTRPQDLAIGVAPAGSEEGDKLYLLGTSTSFGVAPIDASRFYPLDASTVISGARVEAIEVSQVYLPGTTTTLKPGDLLLMVGRQGNTIRTLVRPIRQVTADLKREQIRVDLAADGAPTPAAAIAFRPRFLAPATFELATLAFDKTHVESVVVGKTWRERDLSAFVSIQGWSRFGLIAYVNAPQPPPVALADAGIFAFRARLGLFGHNAPRQETLPSPQNTHGGATNDPYPQPWDGANARSIWTNSQGLDYRASLALDADLYLERTLSDLTVGSWTLMEVSAGGRTTRTPFRVAGTSESSLVDYGLSARATGLSLRAVDGSTPTKSADFKVRATTAYALSERLELAPLPIDQPLRQSDDQLPLDRMVSGLQVGQPLIVTGMREDLPGVATSEVVSVKDVQHSGGLTTLFLTHPLTNSYVRGSVTLNANVALAAHGESVTHVLGSGDGSQSNQTFALKKPPLTYITSDSPSGTESTLQVRVNGVLWQEVPRLYAQRPDSQSYVVRREDDGTTRVIFGDGRAGARLPSGSDNVEATYRSGIGAAGMVGADRLTLLQSRPLGISSVVNPLPASGAEDPEARDRARENAPRTVLTLERIVSVRDVEDFGRAFAGIGKAQAIALAHAPGAAVYLTIAAATPAAEGDDGPPGLTTNVVDANAPVFTRLVDAIARFSDPGLRVVVQSYRPAFFNLRAHVLIDPRYQSDVVLDTVRRNLGTVFAFDARGFGQPVTLSEVITAIQQQPGVVAVRLDQLYRYRHASAPPEPTLPITPAHIPADTVSDTQRQPELLLLNPLGVELLEMTR